MTELVQCLVRGLGDGSVYALLAFGFVIIYKSMGVISFAQPALMLAGAVLVTYLVTTVNFYLAVVLAAAAVALLAVGVERTVLRPMIGKPVFVISIITLGVDIVIRVVVNAYIGLDVRQVGDPWGLSTSRLLGDRGAAAAPDHVRHHDGAGRHPVRVLPLLAHGPGDARGRVRSGSGAGPRGFGGLGVRAVVGDRRCARHRRRGVRVHRRRASTSSCGSSR